MADVNLQRPEAGQRVEVTDLQDARFILDFPSADAILSKDADDLIFTFPDQSVIVVKDFYSTYTRDTLPEFNIDGQTVTGEEFFTALGDEDLMPAAGPAAAPDAARFHEFDNMGLYDGIDKLRGLDLGHSRGAEQEDHLGALGRVGDDMAGARINHIPTVIDHYVSVFEAGLLGHNNYDPNLPSSGGGFALTGSAMGDGVHSFKWNAGNQGHYGEFTQNPDGTFTYQLYDNDEVHALNAGDVRTEVFYYTYTDQDGDSATGRVIITIQGANDSPELGDATDTSIALKEAGVGSQLVGMASQQFTGTGAANKEYGGKGEESGHFTVIDRDAGDTQFLRVELNGSGPEAVVLPEIQITQGMGTQSFTLSAMNTATGEYSTIGNVVVTPTVVVNEHGATTTTYSYSIQLFDDPGDGTVGANWLNEGQALRYDINFIITDGEGAAITHTLNLDVYGTNDAPTLNLGAGETGMHILSEAQFFGENNFTADGPTPSVGGHLIFEDLDADGNMQNITIAGGGDVVGMNAVVGNVMVVKDFDIRADGVIEYHTQWGTLELNPYDGTYTYTPDASGPIRDMVYGQTHKEEFTVQTMDAHGAVSGTQKITVELKGSDTSVELKGTDQSFFMKESGVGSQLIVTKDANGVVTDVENVRVDDANLATAGVGTITNSFQIINHEPGYTWAVNVDIAGKTYTVNLDPNKSGTQTLLTQKITEVKTDGNDEVLGKVNDIGTLTLTATKTATGEFTVTYTFVLNQGAGTDCNAMQFGEQVDLHLNITVDTYDKAHPDPDRVPQTHHADVTIYGTNDMPTGSGSGDVREEGAYIVGGTTFTQDANGNWIGRNTVDTKEGAFSSATNTQTHTTDISGQIKLVDPEGDTLTITPQSTTINLSQYTDAAHKTLTTAAQDMDPVQSAGKDAGGNYVTYEFQGLGTLKMYVDGANQGKFEFHLGENADGTAMADTQLYDSLVPGEKYALNLNFDLADSEGAHQTQTLTINVHGTNDAPSWEFQTGSATLAEAVAGPIGGKLDVIDADLNSATAHESHTFQIANVSVGADGTPVFEGLLNTNGADANGKYTLFEGEFGQFKLYADGSYEYNLDSGNSEVQAHNGYDAPLHDVFYVTVTDSFGATYTRPIDIAVAGTNYAPVMQWEGITVKADGVFHDSHQSLNYSNTTAAGDTLDEHTQHRLEMGGSLKATDVDDADSSLTFKVNDQASGPQLSITMNGQEVANVVQTTTVADGVYTVVTEYGTLTLDSNTGQYNFALADNDAVRSLGEADKLLISVPVAATDPHGAMSDWNALDITILGTNDAPIMLAPEGGYLAVPSGDAYVTKVAGYDADAGETETLRFSMVNNNGQDVQVLEHKYGTIFMDKEGNTTIRLNADGEAALKAMPAGAALHIELEARTQDIHEAVSDTKTITLTLQGVDNPSTVPNHTATGSEGGFGLALGGQVFSDMSTVAVVNPSGNLNSGIGNTDNLALTGGSRSFSFDIAVKNGPAAGVKGEDTHSFGSGEPVDCVTVTYEGYGTLYLDPASGKYEFVVIDDPDSPYDALDKLQAGQQVTFNLTVTATETRTNAAGETTAKYTSTSNLGIVIEGANDAPYFTDASGAPLADGVGVDGAALPAADWQVTGKLTAADPDNTTGELRFSFNSSGAPVQTIQGEHGALTIHPDGSYTYSLDALQNLNMAATTETFTVYVRDPGGAWDTVTLTIPLSERTATGGGGGTYPAEDLGDAAALLQEDRQINDGGRIVGADGSPVSGSFYFKDASGKPVQTMEFKGEDAHGEHTYGSVTINPTTGEYTVTLYNDTTWVQAMSEDTHLDTNVEVFRSFLGTGAGETSASMNISISGDNDAPVFDHDVYTGVSGTVHATDIDELWDKSTGEVTRDQDSLSYSIKDADGSSVSLLQGKYGTLTMNADGSYKYVQGQDANGDPIDLPKGNHVETFNILVDDGHSYNNLGNAQIAINVYGENHAPTISADNTHLAVTVDNYGLNGQVQDYGKATGHDVDGDPFRFTIADNPDAGASYGSAKAICVGQYGTLTINSDGSYTYTLNNMDAGVQGIGLRDDPEAHQDIFYIRTVDKDGGLSAPIQVVVDVQGSNTQPELYLSTSTLNVQGDALSTAGGQATAYDRDVSDRDFLTFSADIAGLDPGATTTEGTTMTINTDYGQFVIDTKSGAYEFHLDTASDAYQSMLEGEKAALNVKITVDDGTGINDPNDPLNGLSAADRYLTVNIVGQHTMPEFEGDTLFNSIDESLTTSITGVIGGVGQGGMDTFIYLGTSEGSPQWTYTDPVYGTKVEIDPNTGGYKVTLDQSNANLIALGPDAEHQTGIIEIPVMIKDAQGGWTHDVLQIEVTGKDDPPTIQGLVNGSVTLTAADVAADAAPVVLTGVVNAYDPDTPQTALSFSLKGGAGVTDNGDGSFTYTCNQGVFVLQADGSYTFTVNMDLAQHIQGGVVQSVNIPGVTISNGTVEVTDNVAVKITGVNQAPTISVTLGGAQVGEDALALTDTVSGSRPAISLSLSATDINTGDTFTYQAAVGADSTAGFVNSVTGQYGTLSFSGGNAVYTLNAGAKALPEDVTKQESFTIRVSDGHGGYDYRTVTFEVTGVNNPPEVILSQPAPAALVPHDLDDSVATSGKLVFGDPDAGDSVAISIAGGTQEGNIITVQGQYGTLEYNTANGSYTYNLDSSNSDVQHLDKASALHDTFTFTADDGHATNNLLTQNLTIDIKSDMHVISTSGGGTITGSSGDDRIFGSETEGNVINAGAGNDIIYTGGGDNVVYGGSGNSMIYGGDGNDTIYGGAGDTYLHGGGGSNALYGLEGNDILVFNANNTVMDGGSGVDFLVGVNNMDSLDQMLGTGAVTNINVIVMGGEDITSLTHMNDMGITVTNNDTVRLDSSWTADSAYNVGANALEQGFEAYTNDDGLTILVQKTIMEQGEL